MADAPNYPDLLGFITGGGRVNVGVVQAALATRPRVVKAGRPFEVIVLLQNACDVDVDVMTTLYLPEMDARRRRDRFVTRTTRLLIGIAPAEVGYVVLPASTLPDTAPGDDYRIGIEIEPRPLNKPQRIRNAEGGGTVSLDLFSPIVRERIDALLGMRFSTTKRIGSNRVETPLQLMGGGITQMTDFKPGWVSVAGLADYKDARPLLHRYGDKIIVDVLPQLKRAVVYPALLETTRAKFAAAGFDLHECEIVLIAKLLTLLIDYAAPADHGHAVVEAGRFGIKPLIVDDPLALQNTPDLPRWFTAFLALMEREPRVTTQPLGVIQRLLYDDLLHDAIRYGFEQVESATGVNFGTAGEFDEYARDLLADMKAGKGGDASRVYLPLIMAGVLVSERMPVSKERPSELLAQLIRITEVRQQAAEAQSFPADELPTAATTDADPFGNLMNDDDPFAGDGAVSSAARTDDNPQAGFAPGRGSAELRIYDMAVSLIIRMGQKYGFHT